MTRKVKQVLEDRSSKILKEDVKKKTNEMVENKKHRRP